jgi:hypothetical protein
MPPLKMLEVQAILQTIAPKAPPIKGCLHHRTDDRLRTLLDVHVLNAHDLLPAVPKAPKRLHLKGKRPLQTRDRVSANGKRVLAAAIPMEPGEDVHGCGVVASQLEGQRSLDFVSGFDAFDKCKRRATSEIPVLGRRHAAINCASEARTNSLEAVPNAPFSRVHHSARISSCG